MQIILASQSPRRKELLSKLLGGDDRFTIVPSDIDEIFDESFTPAQNAEKLALEKAKHVQKSYPNAIIIGADTVVTSGKEQLQKAATRDHAETLLQGLLGTVSYASTGLAVLAPGFEKVVHANAAVTFKSANVPGVQKALRTYLDSNDWKDKAGAYGVQSGAGPLIEKIDGSYNAMLGLPVEQLSDILRQFRAL